MEKLDTLLESVEALTERSKNLAQENLELKEKIKKVDDEKKAVITKGAMPVVNPRGDSSDERKAMLAFRCTNIRDLVNVNTADAKFKYVPDHYKGMVRSLKETITVSRALAVMFKGAPKDHFGVDKAADRIQNLTDYIYETHYGKEILAPMAKAYTTSANSDWTPTVTASEYIQEFELPRQVEQLFRDITQPSNPFDLPVQDDVTIARTIPENTQATDATFNTSKLTFDATKFVQFSILPEEMNEDSAPPILSIVRQDVVEAQMRAMETGEINGDTSSPHQDDDVDSASADDARKAYNGLRKKALDNSANGGTVDFGGGTVTEDGLRSLRKNMSKYGVNPASLAYIMSPSAYHQAVGMDDVTTAEKFTANLATNLTGVLATFSGIPIVVSEYLPENLSANGVNTSGGPNDFTGILLVNHRRFFSSTRRPIRLRVEMDKPDWDRWLMSSYARRDFQGMVQDTTETSVTYGHNIAT